MELRFLMLVEGRTIENDRRGRWIESPAVCTAARGWYRLPAILDAL